MITKGMIRRKMIKEIEMRGGKVIMRGRARINLVKII